MADEVIVYEKINIEDVCESITKGEHYRDIADRYDMPLTSFFRFITKPEHSELIKQARQFAAHILVDEAERVLAQAKEDPRLLWVAKELAHHYRWKASMIYGRQYANKKVVLDEPEEKKEITIKIIRNGNRI